VLCLVNSCTFRIARLIRCGLGPARGFGIANPVAEPIHDRALETADIIAAAAADNLAGNYWELAFDRVEPRHAY
jgi:hypothetical protein